jgi:transcriptional regulator GlxA family with amidase domain
MDRTGPIVPVSGMNASRLPAVRVALLALPQSTPAAVVGLYEVFASAGTAWPMMTGEATAVPALAPRIITADGAPIETAIGLAIQPQAALGPAEVVVVADITFDPDFDPRGQWPVETAWLRERHAAGATICSICTGSIVLAEAGLLNGLPATTHWLAAPLMRDLYPQVRLEPGRILAPVGEDSRIITSGGASSWEDLALFLVARLCGGPEAVRMARLFLFGDRSEGQLVYAGARQARRHEDRAVQAAQAWAAENYSRPGPVPGMAAAAGLHERTFKRRFQAATGYTPLDYVQTVRIEEAKQLLESTELPTEAIAAEVGYEEPAFFRRLFKRRTGVTPASYRRRFARIARIS